MKSERFSTCVMVNYSTQKPEHRNNEMDSSLERKQNLTFHNININLNYFFYF